MHSESKLFLVGTNHRMAPVEIRERIAFPTDQMQHALRDIVGDGGVVEAVILSTCNRVEIIAAAERDPVEELKGFVARYHGLPVAELESFLYQYSAREAVLHLFRVASSLDSMVIGEAQILGQVKEAFSRACEMGTAGPLLRELFPRAFRAAKKVRTETLIATTALSISAIGVELAKKIFGKLDGKSILLVGTGKMAQLASRELRKNGVAKIWVTGRRPERAVQMAVAVAGTPLPYHNLAEVLAASDIVIVSTSAPHFVIDQADMARVVRQRKNQPIFVIDISVPRNVDPNVNQVDNVFLYDIDDLRGIAENNRAGRSQEAVAAERIIQQEADLFLRELNLRRNSPVIVGMRQVIRQICQEEISRAMQKLPGLPPASQQALERMAERISNKISHPFLDHLRRNPKETGKLLSEIFSRTGDED